MNTQLTHEARATHYLAREIQSENRVLAERQVGPATRLVLLKLKELYWTTTRLMGLAHLHDGSRGKSRPTQPRLTDEEAAQHRSALAAPRRVLIDVTPTYLLGGKTGIQRVVREIAKRSAQSGVAVPVIVVGNTVRPYCSHPSLPASIDFRPHDKFLMIDAAWQMKATYLDVTRKLAEAGGQLITVVYDVIPLIYPLSVDPAMQTHFFDWFQTFVLKSDAVICISRSAAMELVSCLTCDDPEQGAKPRVGWWWLGADFSDDETPAAPHVRALDARKTPYFVSVGTLEPRKCYPVALDAFERLWQAGMDLRYVIIGRKGWQSEALEKRITSHPEFGRRLIWLDDASDADLRHCYMHARALVYPSLVEGFGLPLVEAGRYGLPVIASDLPVFREIGGAQVRYFQPMEADALAAAIERLLNEPRRQEKVQPLTWDDAAANLIDLVMNDAYQLSSSDGMLGARAAE